MEIATYRLGQRVFETCRWINREKGCDVSVVVVGSTRSTAQRRAMMTRLAPYVIAALALGLSACTNPYDPVQRGLGGGLLGAASGAAIGAAAGGGPGAALGAAIGGATGIVGGVATTPPPPLGTYYGYSAYGYPGYAQPGYGYPGYSGYPAYSGPAGYGYPGYSGQPGYPAYAGPPGYGYQSRPAYPPPYSGSGYGNPVAGYPGDRPSEDWSPGAEYAIEPSS
jgi:hypothetical protein